MSNTDAFDESWAFMEKQLWSHWSQLLSLRHKEPESPGPVGGWRFIAAPRSSCGHQRSPCAHFLTWGSTSIHVSAISKACCADSSRVTTKEDWAMRELYQAEPKLPMCQGQGPGCPFPHQRVSRLSPERILQTLPNKKEYTGRVLIKALHWNVENLPKIQLEIWHNQSIILILIFRGYINNASCLGVWQRSEELKRSEPYWGN